MPDAKKPEAVPNAPELSPWEAYGVKMGRIEQAYSAATAAARADRKAAIKAAKDARVAAEKAQREASAKPADTAGAAAA